MLVFLKIQWPEMNPFGSLVVAVATRRKCIEKKAHSGLKAHKEIIFRAYFILLNIFVRR